MNEVAKAKEKLTFTVIDGCSIAPCKADEQTQWMFYPKVRIVANFEFSPEMESFLLMLKTEDK